MFFPQRKDVLALESKGEERAEVREIHFSSPLLSSLSCSFFFQVGKAPRFSLAGLNISKSGNTPLLLFFSKSGNTPLLDSFYPGCSFFFPSERTPRVRIVWNGKSKRILDPRSFTYTALFLP